MHSLCLFAFSAILGTMENTKVIDSGEEERSGRVRLNAQVGLVGFTVETSKRQLWALSLAVAAIFSAAMIAPSFLLLAPAAMFITRMVMAAKVHPTIGKATARTHGRYATALLTCWVGTFVVYSVLAVTYSSNVFLLADGNSPHMEHL